MKSLTTCSGQMPKKTPVPPRPAPRPPVPGVSDALQSALTFGRTKLRLENNRTWDTKMKMRKEARAADIQLILDADKEKLETQRKRERKMGSRKRKRKTKASATPHGSSPINRAQAPHDEWREGNGGHAL